MLSDDVRNLSLNLVFDVLYDIKEVDDFSADCCFVIGLEVRLFLFESIFKNVILPFLIFFVKVLSVSR